MSEPSSPSDMKIDASRAAALTTQLQDVSRRIAAASPPGRPPVRLVAVSKLKPANDILALHQAPAVRHAHFGENYAQELRDKAALLPRSVRWHFIGGLQSGHCKPLARVPNLWCVSSVDSPKKATLLDRARGELRAGAGGGAGEESSGEAVDRLNVHVQVNTSGEATKSGCAPGADTVALCRAIEQDCPHLTLLGLMTIGAIARSQATTAEGVENEDFQTLREQRDLVARELGLDGEGGRELELSMGMSEDFEGAIAAGSAEVRIGSTIFGVRPAKADAKVSI